MRNAQHLKPKLHILVGIPGCGKSTYAASLTGNVISSDALREEILKDVNDQSQNEVVFRVFHNMLRWGLSLGTDMIADATSLDSRSRANLREVARETDAEAHLYLFRNTSEALMRNARRDRRVPDDVMVRMVEKYERTLLTLPQERYTSVTEIRSFH
jgi:predicted kinase